jgi:L-2,4-diaminobutyrate decarboxylase
MDQDFREFEAALTRMLGPLEGYLRDSRARSHPVVRLQPIQEIAARLDLPRWIREGGLLQAPLEDFLDSYLAATTRMHHPASMAHQVAVPHLSGALGALLDAFTNNPMAIYEMGPAAATMEYVCVNWMLEKAGWKPSPWPDAIREGDSHGAGVLTHGGSLATLTALAAARRRAAPKAWQDGNPGNLAVFASTHSHYAVARAMGIMGLGQRALLPLPTDERGAILPDMLAATYDAAVQDGWNPMALVANACSTSVGIFDPLRPIAAFCRSHDLWMHVDGAHGASALLSRTARRHLDGIELADSLVWDAHKLLRTPSLCAAVLMRDATALDSNFQQEASYVFHDKTQLGIDLISRTVECTKAGLGLRLFFVLASQGEQQLAAYVDKTFALASTAYRMVCDREGFSSPVEPQANILCLRYRDDDALQLRLRDDLLREGEFHISSTEFLGKRYLRLVLMHPDTDESIIGALLDRIEELAGR